MKHTLNELRTSLLCLAVGGAALLLTGCKDGDEQRNADLQQSRDKQMAAMAGGGSKPSGYDAAKAGASK